MIRHLLVACAVLVPFAGLVALGFSLLKDPPPFVLPPPVVRIEPPPPPPPPAPLPPPPRIEPIRPLPPPLPVSVPVVAPPPPVAPIEVTPPSQRTEGRKLPMLASVEPMVQQCFRDVRDRVREPMKVTVQFDPTSAGRFEHVVLRKTSWQDPMLAACIIDSFEDAKFEPAETRVKRQSYTFTFELDGGF